MTPAILYLGVSPKSSPASPALSIGFPSSMDSIRSTSSSSSTSSTSSTRSSSSRRDSACAYPSWPLADSLCSYNSFGSSPSLFISDAELFGDDLEYDSEDLHAPYLDEAPPPPRQYAQPTQVAMPLLPLFAQPKPEKKRRRSPRRPSSRANPMTPISESPETPR